MFVKTLVAASSMVLLQHPPSLFCSAYPTKPVTDLVDDSLQDGGDGGCDSSTHKYVQVDTINNLDPENSDYSVTFTQLTAECGQPFTAGYKPYSISGHFAPGDVQPDEKNRSQLNLYFCAPYGDYKIDIAVNGDFEYQEGKRIGWEIEDGQTQAHCWDTFNPAEYTNAKYNPMEPGSYSWPLPGETDDHMSRFYVSREMTSPPADPECDGFVPDEAQETSPPVIQETEAGVGSSADGGASVVLGAPLGCFEDSPANRVFAKTEGAFSSGNHVTVQDCANMCFFNGYPYMGVEFANECYCGESLPAAPAAPLVELSRLSCSMACAGNAVGEEALCGGDDAIMIYSLDGEDSTPPPASGGGGGGGGGGGDGSGSGEAAAGGGCYKDDKEARVLTGTRIVKDENMTHQLCEGLCRAAEGMGVYGVEHGHECFCGLAAPVAPTIADSFCGTPCAGDDLQKCGGRDAIQVVAL